MVVAECPAIPGCVSQGSTEAEAEKNVGDAIRECLAARRERNLPLMITTKDTELPFWQIHLVVEAKVGNKLFRPGGPDWAF